ncbi:MAG: transporter [Elusimicrobia bacterium]|nr:transporter [Elusimicrobiota bacterium]
MNKFMKKYFVLFWVLVCLVSLGFSEPIMTEESKCLTKNNLEVGLGLSYGVDSWEWVGTWTGDNKVSATVVQIPVRYGLSDKLQLNLSIPYRSWASEIEVGSAKSNTNESGLGQISIGGKYGVSENIAVGLDIQTPTADIDKSLGEGTNVGLLLIASTKFKTLNISGNAEYLLKMKYEDDNDTKYDPADLIIVRAAVEYPINALSLIGEVQGQFFGKSKTTLDGGTETDVADSNGSTLDFLVGSQYLKDPLKLKLGVKFAVGDESLRGGVYPFYDSWDWKVILSGSYKIGL